MGYYGANTASAVKQFQTSAGIPATGFVGPLTRAALNAMACKGGGEVPTLPTITYPDEKASFYITSVQMKTETPYAVGEPIIFRNLKGVETNGGLSSTLASEGFHVQARLIDMKDPYGGVDSINAVFDPTTNSWSGSFAGNYPAGTYKVTLILYCMQQGSYCDQKYDAQHVGYQNEKDIIIAVGDQSTASPSLTVLSPNGGETYEQPVTAINFSGKANYVPKKLVAYLYAPDRGNVAWLTPSVDLFGNFKGSIVGDPGIGTGQYKITVCDEGTDSPIVPGKPLCDSSDNYFSLVDVKSNTAPVITGLTAPSVLNVGQTGTWKVQVSDAEGGSLSYSIDWGDVVYGKGSISKSAVQSTIFTHSYSSTGTYIVWITVTDEGGKYAQTSATVTVTSTAVTAAPVIYTVAGKAAGNGEIDAGGSVGITGVNLSGYKDSTNVYIGGSVCTITQLSSTLIYCTAPSNLQVGSSYDLYINSVGSGGDKVSSNVVRVKVLSNVSTPPTPAITSIPNPVVAGQRVTMYGKNFVSGSIVRVLSPVSLDIRPSYMSSTRIDFTMPSSASGVYSLRIVGLGATPSNIVQTRVAQPTTSSSDYRSSTASSNDYLSSTIWNAVLEYYRTH